MSEDRKKVLKLTGLRYKNLPLLMEATKGDEGLVGEIVRIHLVAEFLLEELIRLGLEKNAESVLSVGLKYSQKLELASRLELVEEFNLLPDYVTGSFSNVAEIHYLQFPSIEAFKEYRADPEHIELSELRKKAISNTTVFVSGNTKDYGQCGQ